MDGRLKLPTAERAPRRHAETPGTPSAETARSPGEDSLHAPPPPRSGEWSAPCTMTERDPLLRLGEDRPPTSRHTQHCAGTRLDECDLKPAAVAR